MTPWPPEITLEGRSASLVPLRAEHAEPLCNAVRDGELWKLWYTRVPAPQDMEAEIARRLSLREKGSMLPFAVISRESGLPVGMTTYMNVEPETPRLEIGSTWYRRAVQRTPVNTECKLMLLTHAFDDLGCVAVEFRTHVLNTASRRAIERLGARLDGILRSHIRLPNGTLRDTCVYSITAADWPATRANLTWQLERSR